MGVFRKDDLIAFVDLKSPRDPGYLISQIYQGQTEGYDSFKLDFSKVDTIFPNSAVPVSGLIEYYTNRGLDLDIVGTSDMVESTGILSPFEPENEEHLSTINILSKVLKFSSGNHVFWIVNAILREFERDDVFGSGVLHGLQWCINEAMDNVIQHSGQDCGYIMAQIHKSTKHVAITIFDSGQGIYNSLKDSPHHPRTAIDALTMSLQERVTRDREVGQGNGMFGLRRVIEANQGRLALTSHAASYLLHGNIVRTFNRIPCPSWERASTTVDIQLGYDREVSIAEALKFEGRSYVPVHARAEEMEDEAGQIRYLVREESEGYGTRVAGARVRNDVINLMQEHHGGILLDFDGIDLITSSYADEFIGKLVDHFGFVGFNQLFRLINLSGLAQGIVHRSVAMRLAQTLQDGEAP